MNNELKYVYYVVVNHQKCGEPSIFISKIVVLDHILNENDIDEILKEYKELCPEYFYVVTNWKLLRVEVQDD